MQNESTRESTKLTYGKNGPFCIRLLGTVIEDITKYYHDLHDKKLEHLTTLCSRLNDSKDIQISFTEDAFQDFHHLVLSTLIGYYSLLHECPETADKQQMVSDTWRLLRMLWRISRSQMFKVYLEILAPYDLRLPTKEASKAFDLRITALMRCNTQKDSNKRWEVETAEGEEGYGDDAEEEITRLMQTPYYLAHNHVENIQTVLVPNTFQRWMWLQANHLSGLNILSTLANKVEETVNISLLAVN
jgi:hypothetical protein